MKLNEILIRPVSPVYKKPDTKKVKPIKKIIPTDDAVEYKRKQKPGQIDTYA